jgi:hypothetical protein
MDHPYTTAGAVIGAAIPIAATATQINYSDPIEAGVYIGLSAGAALLTGLTGLCLGNKLERKLNNNKAFPNP